MRQHKRWVDTRGHSLFRGPILYRVVLALVQRTLKAEVVVPSIYTDESF